MKINMPRFWVKVKKTNKCWDWQGASRGNGYGCIKYKGKVYDTHRFVFFLKNGYFAPLWISHKCGNRKCVRLDHLCMATPKQNFDAMLKKGVPHPSIYAYKRTKYTKEEAHRIDLEASRKWYRDIKADPIRYAEWRTRQRRNAKLRSKSI